MFYYHNVKIKKYTNLYSNLNKIFGFKDNYFTFILKKMGLNIFNNKINKNILLLNIKMVEILKLNIEKKKNLGKELFNLKKENLSFKLNKHPLMKYKYYKGYPIRGQRTRNNINTNKSLNYKF